ncbi:hypothetical protein BVC71_07895 [Marivivens niveibacter]|uniref:ABC transmembrane type-1 domain-containing protein n=1 Tax=Marivivens niveibacter TaxID=1930667 RepID=A0A251X0B1_9RHOB|nr:ABC transporter permease subunit [Marivivens niveibacter]OUD09744.1 hypothetical protein BVC71_07895 [Marivivens niveibacter]
MMRAVVIVALIGPVIAGLIGVALPAIGYFPAIGRVDWGLEAFRDVIAWQGFGPAARLSVFTGLAATALSIIVSFFLLAALTGNGQKRLRLYLGPMLALPHAAVGFAIVFLIDPTGIVSRLIAQLVGWSRPPDVAIIGDPWGLSLILGLVVKEIPFLLFMALAALPPLAAFQRIKACKALGYGQMAAWIYAVAIPLYRAIRMPVFLVLAYSMTVVDMAIILGPTTPPTLSVQIVKWMASPDLNVRMVAAAGAIVQLLLVLAVFAIWLLIETVAKQLILRSAKMGYRIPRLGAASLRVGRFVRYFPVLFVCFLGILLLWSFAGFWSFPNLMPDGLTTRVWDQEAGGLTSALSNAAVIGICVAGVSTLCAIAVLESGKRVAPYLLFVPLIVPQVAFLLGLQVFMIHIGVRSGMAAVMFVHFVFVMPYVLLTLQGAYDGYDRRYDRVAAALGRSYWVILWRVRLPILIAPIISAFAVGFAVSVAQYLPTLLIGGGRVATITTDAVALASGGDRRVIASYALLQAIAAVGPLLIAAVLPYALWRNRKGLRHA